MVAVGAVSDTMVQRWEDPQQKPRQHFFQLQQLHQSRSTLCQPQHCSLRWLRAGCVCAACTCPLQLFHGATLQPNTYLSSQLDGTAACANSATMQTGPPTSRPPYACPSFWAPKSSGALQGTKRCRASAACRSAAACARPQRLAARGPRLSRWVLLPACMLAHQSIPGGLVAAALQVPTSALLVQTTSTCIAHQASGHHHSPCMHCKTRHHEHVSHRTKRQECSSWARSLQFMKGSCSNKQSCEKEKPWNTAGFARPAAASWSRGAAGSTPPSVNSV